MELVGCTGYGVHLALNHYGGPKSLQPVSWAWSPNQAPVLLIRVGSGKGCTEVDGCGELCFN